MMFVFEVLCPLSLPLTIHALVVAGSPTITNSLLLTSLMLAIELPSRVLLHHVQACTGAPAPLSPCSC